jgi:hypothetical protein
MMGTKTMVGWWKRQQNDEKTMRNGKNNDETMRKQHGRRKNGEK